MSINNNHGAYNIKDPVTTDTNKKAQLAADWAMIYNDETY